MEDKIFEEYSKFIKKQVTVEYWSGDQTKELSGELRFLSHNYLSCVVMTETEKIIIKNIITIRRKRKE